MKLKSNAGPDKVCTFSRQRPVWDLCDCLSVRFVFDYCDTVNAPLDIPKIICAACSFIVPTLSCVLRKQSVSIKKFIHHYFRFAKLYTKESFFFWLCHTLHLLIDFSISYRNTNCSKYSHQSSWVMLCILLSHPLKLCQTGPWTLFSVCSMSAANLWSSVAMSLWRSCHVSLEMVVYLGPDLWGLQRSSYTWWFSVSPEYASYTSSI